MMFDDDDLRNGGLSQSAIARLHSRQSGGESGAAGYQYQRRYALFRALQLAHTDRSASIAQEALCPVDDVVVTAATSEYAQCKMSPTETWTRDRKKLQAEFVAQSKLLQRLGRVPARLVLVVPDAKRRALLETKRPFAVKAASAVPTYVACLEHPAVPSQPWTVPAVAAALDSLLPPILRVPSQRENLYRRLDSEANQPWTARTVEELCIIASQKDQRLPLVLPWGRAWAITGSAWTAALDVLRAIPNLVMDTAGDICCYRSNRLQGFVARCDTPLFQRFVDDVTRNPPNTMIEFQRLVPS